jgi:phospholipid/cholesterol/gamma-HCH transport system permease protein
MSSFRAGWLSWGHIVGFGGLVIRRIYTGRVLRVFGEILRQASLLITGSVGVVLGLVFVLGLQCGIEGAYGSAAVGAGNIAGAITALCDLREVTPYAFGYMMAAKVATGYAAEIGAMRIGEEIDALDVMGVESITFLCATRVMAVWLVLPFLYASAVAVGFIGSYLAVVTQVAQTTGSAYLAIFWQFQSPPDMLFSLVKAMAMATFVTIVGCYYGYTATGGPIGVGRASARSMAVNIIGIHAIGIVGTQLFWGNNPRSPVGG